MNRRYAATSVVVSAILLGVIGCAAPGSGSASNWTCSAAGMISASYDGSDYANVHLQGFSSGGSYRVTLNAEKTEAKGTTGNGTPFTCVKKQ